MGNQAISYYSYQSVLDQANYSFGGTVVQGVAPVDGANRDLIWETTASYAFEQDFTFDFEDYDEMQAFIDTNHDQLDNYKEEYPSVMNWIEAGMIC